MALTTSCMVIPARSTSTVPASTRSTLAEIRVLISLAASALRCARLRTSEATTANPRPWSPARAASTAAFKARILVWNAIPSMTLMMSEIFFDVSLMPCIVLTTWLTTSPPRIATLEALSASLLASVALSAFLWTADPNSAMDAAVCSSALAWFSVRLDKSMSPAAISWEPMAISSAAARTCDTMADRLSLIRLSELSSCPTSSLPFARMRALRSPAATRSANATALANGRVTLRTIQKPAPIASKAATKPPPARVSRVAAISSPLAAPVTLTVDTWRASSLPSATRNGASMGIISSSAA